MLNEPREEDDWPMQLAQQAQLGEALGSSPAFAVLPRSAAAPLWVSLPLLYKEGAAVSDFRGNEILKDTAAFI